MGCLFAKDETTKSLAEPLIEMQGELQEGNPSVRQTSSLRENSIIDLCTNSDDVLYMYKKRLAEVGPAGWEELCDAIRSNTKLARLIVSCNNLGAVEHSNLTLFGGAIKSNNSISWIDLDSNEIDDEGLQSLVLGLEGAAALEEIILDHNNLTDASCDLLSRVCTSWPRLKRLDFEENERMTEAGMRRLAKALVTHTDMDVNSFVNSYLD